MSVPACIAKKVATGLLTSQQGKDVLDLIDTYQQQNASTMSPAMAQVTAGQQALNRLKATKQQEMFQRATTLMATFRRTDAIINHESGDRFAGFKAQFSPDIGQRGIQDNFDARRLQVRSEAGAYMARSLHDLKPTLGRTFSGENRHGKATDAEIASELMGRPSGNPMAAELVTGYRKASAYLLGRFRAAGGLVGELTDYDLPHSHNVPEMVRRGRQEWTDYVYDRLDRSRMKDLQTGALLNDNQVRQLLDTAFDTITGRTAFDGPSGGGRLSIGNSRSQNRMLHFKDDGWLEYNTEFKGPDYFTTIMSHIDDMSHDIAHLELFGANSKQTFEEMKRVVRQQLAERDEDAGKYDRAMDAYIGNVTGTALKVSNRDWARSMGDVRKVMSSAMLGSAVMLSVPGDLITSQLALSYSNLPLGRFIANYTKEVFGSSDARQVAAQVGLASEFLLGRLHGGNRFMEGEVAHEMAGRIADLNMTLSGMDRFTDAARESFGLTYAMRIAELKGRTFDSLDRADRRFMETYGITKQEWDAAKDHLPTDDLDGTPVFNAVELGKDPAYRDVARRIHQGILAESQYAVIGTSTRTEVTAQMGQQKGTVMGELAASAMMFKRFPIEFMNQQFGRMVRNTRITNMERLNYVGSFVVGMMAYGALAVQMREVASGKQPLDMTTPEFWVKAFLVSGAGSIMVDLVNSGFDFEKLAAGDPNYDGGNKLLQYIVGPVLAAGADLASNLGNTAYAATAGKPGSLRKALAKDLDMASRYVPLRSLWYTKLAMQRLLVEQAERAIDPSYEHRLRKQQRDLMRRTGQEFWWRPGSPTP